jgi:hypothetical protein
MTDVKDNTVPIDPTVPVLGKDLTTIPKDKLAEGIAKMLTEHGYPHVMLAFADAQGGYQAMHTGTVQAYRLHRLLGVALDKMQVAIDEQAATPAPTSPADRGLGISE